MEPISIREILYATGGEMINRGSSDCEITNISVDSREAVAGTLFVPIVGERTDAHDFISAAFDTGACATLTSKRDIGFFAKPCILVNDTMEALQSLASYYRDKFDIPVIGVTGSVGKTSTKEMIYSALSPKLNCLKTLGNQNSQIGLPLTIFNIEKSHEAAVIEMGMSQPGEMSRLSKIAKPTIAAITNIGISHIENLHSKDNILKEKLHIADFMEKSSPLFVNGDDEMLRSQAVCAKQRTVTFGFADSDNLKAENVVSGTFGTTFELELGSIQQKFAINAVGSHNVLNALCAIGIGLELDVGVDDLVVGIASFKSPKMRQEIHAIDGYTLIDDSYNSSPDSMKSGIDVLNTVGGDKKKILVCADMLELGSYATKAHFDLGIYAAQNGVTHIVSIGKLAKNISLGAKRTNTDVRTHVCALNSEAYDLLREMISPGDTVLVKGSRGMKTEEIVRKLLDSSSERKTVK